MPGLVAAVVVLYDRVERRIRALAEPVGEIVRLTQPIDVERFMPAQPLRARPLVAMTLGNYVHGQRLALLQRACDRAGLELRHVGAHGDGQRPANLVLSDADIVFGKARVILEAMACGRAAYVFDHHGGDGWVTGANYAQLSADNFGGQSLPDALDEDRIVADLAAYDPGMGIVNRDLVVAHHAATNHAAALAEVLARVAVQPRPAAGDVPLREIGRLLRLYHRADVQAFAARVETEAFAERARGWERRAQELERHAQELNAARIEAHVHADARAAQVVELQAELAEARAAAATQAAAAAEAESAASTRAAEAARLLGEVTGTRRWRALQTLLAPADRLRRAVSRGPNAGAPQKHSAPLPPAPPRADAPPPAPPRAEETLAPAPPRALAPPPPAPFVVGVARSGTTLLRLQLDSHPALAIGPETGWGIVASQPGLAGAAPPDLLAALVAMDTWPDLGLDPADALRALEQAQPWSLGNGLRALYATLAVRDGKPRWGDKTPVHSAFMPGLAAALPEARFIHVIRDGRDVAASVRDLPFAPGDGSIEAIAQRLARPDRRGTRGRGRPRALPRGPLRAARHGARGGAARAVRLPRARVRRSDAARARARRGHARAAARAPARRRDRDDARRAQRSPRPPSSAARPGPGGALARSAHRRRGRALSGHRRRAARRARLRAGRSPDRATSGVGPCRSSPPISLPTSGSARTCSSATASRSA